MKTGDSEAKPHYGIAHFERRAYRRFPVSLPIEYSRVDSSINRTGQTLDASEGGFQILFPEPMEIGQDLNLKLFFSSKSGLNVIKMLVQIVWMNTELDQGEQNYRSGVRLVDISPEDMTKLKTFLASFL